MKQALLIIFLGISFCSFTQSKPTYDIGILGDVTSPLIDTLFVTLMEEVRAVVGEDAHVTFRKEFMLMNNFNKDKAHDNFIKLEFDPEVDIILAFGLTNNTVIVEESAFNKPTILFGNISDEFISEDGYSHLSEYENLLFLTDNFSIEEDLRTLQEIIEFNTIGIAVVKPFLENFPVEETIKSEYTGKKIKMIPFDGVDDIIEQADSIDALYLAEGTLLLPEKQIEELADTLISRKIPSFSSFGTRDVEAGILATNQPSTSVNRVLRRIALNIESIINGAKPNEMPNTLNIKKKLSLNFNTAIQIGVSIKYSQISRIDIVGSFDSNLAKKKYDLQEVMNIALDQNLDLQATYKDVELAEQDVTFSKSNYLPDLEGGLSGSYVDPALAEASTGQNPEISSTASATLSQTVYSPDASANINIQKNVKEAQLKTYNAEELNTALEAANLYFNILLSKSNLQINAKNRSVTEENLQIATQKFETGESSKSDMLRFTSELATNTQSLVEAVNSLKQSFYQLNQVLNNPIDSIVDIEDAELGSGVFEEYDYMGLKELLDDPRYLEPITDFLVKEAKINSPELASLDFNIKASEFSYKLSDKGRYLPTIGFQGQYQDQFYRGGKGTEFFPGFPEPPFNYYTLGLNLSLPIFNQNQNNINRQTAQVQLDQLRINKMSVELTLEQNVRSGILDLTNQLSNIELSAVAEEAARESLELTQEAYSEGAVGRVELIDAQNNFFQAQLASANSIYNYLQNAISLERQTGSIYLLLTQQERQEFNNRVLQYLQDQ